MKCVHDYARENLKLTADTMKIRHDKTINFHEYNVGDAVWLHDATKKEGLSKKLRNHWIGPFLVIKKIKRCDLQNSGNSDIKTKGGAFR